jgi:hypothetical protein
VISRIGLRRDKGSGRHASLRPTPYLLSLSRHNRHPCFAKVTVLLADPGERETKSTRAEDDCQKKIGVTESDSQGHTSEHDRGYVIGNCRKLRVVRVACVVA